MRINRNTRRSAKPVFRSVNSSRRRAVNSARRRNMNCSANSNVVYYADLNKAQKDYVLANWEKWSEMGWLWNIFYEDEAESENDTPETWWVDDMLTELSYDDIATFEIVDDKTAVPEKKAPDDFNTYINYLNSSRRRNGRRVLNSARSLEIYSFSELNEAQKDYVVKNVMNTFLGDSIWEFFNETIMDQYRYDVSELAREYEAKISSELGFDFSIDESKLYWQSNSQGPYPEWNLGDVFGDLALLEGDIWFDGKGLDVDKAVYTSDASEDPQAQEDLNRTADYLAETLQGFINEVWSLVNEVCQAYPDEDYIYDDLEANDFGNFVVLSETEAKPVRV